MILLIGDVHELTETKSRMKVRLPGIRMRGIVSGKLQLMGSAFLFGVVKKFREQIMVIIVQL
jgi:hypothetical protein